MVKDCRFQLRLGMGGPVGLDFGAVMLMAQARGAVSPLLSEVLPDLEMVLMHMLQRDPEDDDGPGGE